MLACVAVLFRFLSGKRESREGTGTAASPRLSLSTALRKRNRLLRRLGNGQSVDVSNSFPLDFFYQIRRWGFIQFSTDAINKTEFVRTPNWPVYSALVMLYDAEKVSMIVVLVFVSFSPSDTPKKMFDTYYTRSSLFNLTHFRFIFRHSGGGGGGGSKLLRMAKIPHVYFITESALNNLAFVANVTIIHRTEGTEWRLVHLPIILSAPKSLNRSLKRTEKV